MVFLPSYHEEKMVIEHSTSTTNLLEEQSRHTFCAQDKPAPTDKHNIQKNNNDRQKRLQDRTKKRQQEESRSGSPLRVAPSRPSSSNSPRRKTSPRRSQPTRGVARIRSSHRRTVRRFQQQPELQQGSCPIDSLVALGMVLCPPPASPSKKVANLATKSSRKYEAEQSQSLSANSGSLGRHLVRSCSNKALFSRRALFQRQGSTKSVTSVRSLPASASLSTQRQHTKLKNKKMIPSSTNFTANRRLSISESYMDELYHLSESESNVDDMDHLSSLSESHIDGFDYLSVSESPPKNHCCDYSLANSDSDRCCSSGYQSEVNKKSISRSGVLDNYLSNPNSRRRLVQESSSLPTNNDADSSSRSPLRADTAPIHTSLPQERPEKVATTGGGLLDEYTKIMTDYPDSYHRRTGASSSVTGW